MIQVVWFKRDLRFEDHAPLAEAARRGPVLPLYVFEPSVVSAPDFSGQHAGFARECLTELDAALRIAVERRARERALDHKAGRSFATGVLEPVGGGAMDFLVAMLDEGEGIGCGHRTFITLCT